MIKPDDGYIAFIVNPKSGCCHSGLQSQLLERYLAANGFEVKANLTKSLEDAAELATEAAVDYNCAVVVAVGGDGTVREVAHGLEGSDKPMLIVPQGTENLLANELGYDHKFETVIKTFEAGYTRNLDLGRANGKCFTCIVGFGYDGDVVAKVNKAQRELRFDDMIAARHEEAALFNVRGTVNSLDRYMASWRRRRDRVLLNDDAAGVKRQRIRDLEAERDVQLAIVPFLLETIKQSE